MIASGRGFADNEVALLPSFGAAARVDVKHRVGADWGLVASAHAQLDVLTPTVYFRRAGERVNVFEAEPMTFQLAAGITHEFDRGSRRRPALTYEVTIMRVWWFLGFLAIFGCQGSVGNDDCIGEDVVCAAPEPVRKVLEFTDISTRELERIRPIWSREIAPEDDYPLVHLVGDSEDRAWMFYSTADKIEITTRDRDGEVLEEGVVQGPVQSGDKPSLIAISERFGGPVLEVQWSNIAAEVRGSIHEWIKLGANPSDARQRLRESDLSVGFWTWDAQGNTYAATESNAIERRDRRSRLLWSQNGWATTQRPDLVAIVRANGGKVAAVTTDFDVDPEARLFMLDADGNFIAKESMVLTFSIAGGLRTWQDANGFTLTTTSSQGDLTIFRKHDSEPFRLVRILREDFAALSAGACSADPAGNLYCMTRIGGRKFDEQVTIVCRVPIEGAESCVELEPGEMDVGHLFGLAAFSDNVLLILRGERYLERSDFPL